MKPYPIRFVGILAIFACWASAAIPPIERPSPEALKNLGICESGSLRLCVSYEGIPGGQYAFSVYEVSCADSVHYVFWSKVMQDVVTYPFLSDCAVLNFFELRFRGVANDLIHGKPRRDVMDGSKYGGGLSAALLPLVYSGYANAIKASCPEFFK